MTLCKLIPSRKAHTLSFLSKTIRHTDFIEAYSAIRNCHKTSGCEPKCMFLIGPSGAGKSTIAKSYLKEYPVVQEEGATITPVVYISLDARSSLKEPLGLLLEALGDIVPPTAEKHILQRRLKNYIKSCGVQMIIIDEIHHVLPAHTTTMIQHFADLIKAIMDKTLVPFILIGLPGSTKLLHVKTKEDIEDQLFRRARKTVEINPPAPSSSNWKNLIYAYQKALGEIPCINLSCDEMLARLYMATKGLNGRIANLLSEALELTEGEEILSLAHFEKAYIEANPTYETDKNPFTLSLREVKRYVSSTKNK